MKRLGLCLALLLLLCGCGTAEGEERSAQGYEEQEVGEEEVLRAYERAKTAWSWFELEPLAHGEEGRERDGFLYWTVTEPGFSTYMELETYLERLFSSELTEQLLSSGGKAPLYRSIDGDLCVRDFGRDRDWSKGQQQIQVERVEEDAFSVNVTVDVFCQDGSTVEGLECWAFPYEWTENGWVFTSFRSID